jgi:hypothetical protein
MTNLTKSEWAIFVINLALAAIIIIGIIWTVSTQQKPCWSNTASEVENITKCEEHSK